MTGSVFQSTASPGAAGPGAGGGVQGEREGLGALHGAGEGGVASRHCRGQGCLVRVLLTLLAFQLLLLLLLLLLVLAIRCRACSCSCCCLARLPGWHHWHGAPPPQLPPQAVGNEKQVVHIRSSIEQQLRGEGPTRGRATGAASAAAGVGRASPRHQQRQRQQPPHRCRQSAIWPSCLSASTPQKRASKLPSERCWYPRCCNVSWVGGRLGVWVGVCVGGWTVGCVGWWVGRTGSKRRPQPPPPPQAGPERAKSTHLQPHHVVGPPMHHLADARVAQHRRKQPHLPPQRHAVYQKITLACAGGGGWREGGVPPLPPRSACVETPPCRHAAPPLPRPLTHPPTPSTPPTPPPHPPTHPPHPPTQPAPSPTPPTHPWTAAGGR